MKTKKTWLLGFMVLMFGAQWHAGAAHAGEVCDTIESCRTLLAKAEAHLATLLEGVAPPSLTDIARNPDGSVRRMNQRDADHYCRGQKLRLPTVRELALYVQSLGAQGISETAKPGFDLVKGSDSTGNSDNFYFSYAGYQRPEGDNGSYSLWSLSVALYGGDDGAYEMDGFNGLIAFDRQGFRDEDESEVVRCVR